MTVLIYGLILRGLSQMKKSTSILFNLVLGVFLLAGCASRQTTPSMNRGITDEKLTVYTSFYTMYDFASKIGGDKIEITNMVPAGTEPHDWEPTATDITNLERANVFIYNGAGMEPWAEDILEPLQNKELIVVEASKGILLIEGRHEDEEALVGEEKKEYDPHVWLDPVNAKKEMENIKNAFVKADSDNGAYYEANYEKYSTELDILDTQFKDTLSVLGNKDIIVAHQAFGYLCAAYGLNQVAIEGLSADSEPDPARMVDIINFAKKHHVKTIFFEELVSPKVAETIAKAIDAKTDVLNPIEGLSDKQQAAGDDYFSVMRQNLQSLKAALQ